MSKQVTVSQTTIYQFIVRYLHKLLHLSNSVPTTDFKAKLHEHRRSISAYNKCVGAQSLSPCWLRALLPARASISIPVELCRERTDCVHLYGFNQTAALRLSANLPMHIPSAPLHGTLLLSDR